MRISDWSSDVCSSDLAYWFHATVRNENQAETRWVLVQQYALSDFIDLYVRYPDGRVIHNASGDHRPFSARSIRDRHPNFLPAPPPQQPLELPVPVRSSTSIQVPPATLTQTALPPPAPAPQFANA